MRLFLRFFSQNSRPADVSFLRRSVSIIHFAYAGIATLFFIASLWEVAQWLWHRYSYQSVVWIFAWSSMSYVAFLILSGAFRILASIISGISSRRKKAGLPGFWVTLRRKVAWTILLPFRGIGATFRRVQQSAVWSLKCAHTGILGVWSVVLLPGRATLGWYQSTTTSLAAAKKRRTLAKIAQQKEKQEKDRLIQEQKLQQEAARAVAKIAEQEAAERQRLERVAAETAAQETLRRQREDRNRADAERALVLSRQLEQARQERLARRAKNRAAICQFFRRCGILPKKALIQTGSATTNALKTVFQSVGIWSGWGIILAGVGSVVLYDLYAIKQVPLWTLQVAVSLTIFFGILLVLFRKAPFVRVSWKKPSALVSTLVIIALVWAWHFGAVRTLLADRSPLFTRLAFWGVLLVAFSLYSAIFTNLCSVVSRGIFVVWTVISRARFSREKIQTSSWWVRRQQGRTSTRSWIRTWVTAYASLCIIGGIAAFVIFRPTPAKLPHVDTLPKILTSTKTTMVADQPVVTNTPTTSISLPEPVAPTIITRYLGCAGTSCDSGAEVETLQHILKNTGYYTGSVDGTYSKDLGTALDKFLTIKAPGRDWNQHRFHGLLAVDQYRAMQKIYPDLFKAAPDNKSRR